MGKKQTYNDFANARNTIKCPTEVGSYSLWDLLNYYYYYFPCVHVQFKKSGPPWPLCVFQEHPYIFTKVNSFPPATTAAPGTASTAPSESSTASATASTGQPPPAACTDTVPVWLTAVLAVAGLLTGCVVTWLLLSCRAKRNKRLMTSAVEMRGTSF